MAPLKEIQQKNGCIQAANWAGVMEGDGWRCSCDVIRFRAIIKKYTRHYGIMFILNTYIIDNSGPGRIFSFTKQSVSTKQCWCCHLVFWPVPPSTTSTWIPVTTELQLWMSDLLKPKMSPYDSQIWLDKVRIKTRICTGDAFERWRRLKEEKNLEANVAYFVLDRSDLAKFG